MLNSVDGFIPRHPSTLLRFLRASSAVNWLPHGLNERVSLNNWKVTYRFVVPKHLKARLLLKRKQNRNKHLKEVFNKRKISIMFTLSFDKDTQEGRRYK